jgi:hypothetical protein
LRIPPTIENTKNQDDVSLHPIIDRIREPLGQQPMEAEHLSMNSCVKHKGINVGKQAVLKIVTNPDLQTIVKLSAGRKVRHGGLKKSGFSWPSSQEPLGLVPVHLLLFASRHTRLGLTKCNPVPSGGIQPLLNKA